MIPKPSRRLLDSTTRLPITKGVSAVFWGLRTVLGEQWSCAVRPDVRLRGPPRRTPESPRYPTVRGPRRTLRGPRHTDGAVLDSVATLNPWLGVAEKYGIDTV